MRLIKGMYVFTTLSIALTLFAGSAYASWAYSFVVYHGNTYVVTDERVEPSQIGSRIGKVTKYSDDEGTYSGNFSNQYPKGTKYYHIIGVKVRDAIAVKEAEDLYVKATYRGKYAGGKNRAVDGWPIVLIALLVLLLAGYYRKKKSIR
ncbi:hypothetical protein SAMN05216312_103206 [Cohnella sp. OV330]|uniref:hypothetical protein n=1 Tax=Cohnella sp. OV330 TaxID=1855288 RepID=UPI0008E2E90F|nr:hypothetical protein [Cohnella sp. OV330]SFB04910.1 hypothetical protein SAMN05216312_103206 [Cohnella sp. OV330]